MDPPRHWTLLLRRGDKRLPGQEISLDKGRGSSTVQSWQERLQQSAREAQSRGRNSLLGFVHGWVTTNLGEALEICCLRSASPKTGEVNSNGQFPRLPGVDGHSIDVIQRASSEMLQSARGPKQCK